jgi:hypothetical protein
MLNIYTHDIQNGKETIRNIDTVFKFNLISGKLAITDEMKTYIKQIDNAEIVSDTEMITDFGRCSINNLSTGVKTVILMMMYKDKYNFDLTFCGKNVLYKAFELADKYGIDIIIRHIEIPDNTDYTFKINNRIVNSYLDIAIMEAVSDEYQC